MNPNPILEDLLNSIRMIDISTKPVTTREAEARGTISLTEEAFLALQLGSLKKGNALEAARVAGILAAKKTSELIPLCHPVPIERIHMEFEIDPAQKKVTVEVTVAAEAKTGVEMEALEAVSQALLTIYDMCKPYGQEMTIGEIYLVSKKGGKSGDYEKPSLRGGEADEAISKQRLLRSAARSSQ